MFMYNKDVYIYTMIRIKLRTKCNSRLYKCVSNYFLVVVEYFYPGVSARMAI